MEEVMTLKELQEAVRQMQEDEILKITFEEVSEHGTEERDDTDRAV